MNKTGSAPPAVTARIEEIKAEIALRDQLIRNLWPCSTVREIAFIVGMLPRSVQIRAKQLGFRHRHLDARPQEDAA